MSLSEKLSRIQIFNLNYYPVHTITSPLSIAAYMESVFHQRTCTVPPPASLSYLL